MCDAAEKLINDSHPEIDQINDRKNEVLEAWEKLKNLASTKQEKLYGAHEIQRLVICPFPYLDGIVLNP